MSQPPPASSARPLAAELAIAAVLVLSLPGFMGIPFMQPLGADLQNLYAFHQCAFRDDPYLASGLACGDVAGRDMLYPPPLYWSFAWVRPLTWPAVQLIWTSVIAVGTFLSLLAFAPPGRWRGDGRLGLFAGLLLVGYPLLFSIERGNNDVLVLLCWAAAAVAVRAGRAGLAGLAIGLSVALKFYPGVGAVPLAAATLADLWRRPERRPAALRFAAGGLVGLVVPNAPVAGQLHTWATVKLPVFSAPFSPPQSFNHVLAGATAPVDPWPLQAILVLGWAAVAVRRWREDPPLVLAGALAISTTLARTSFDYNLITALPLLLVLYQRATSGGRWRPWVDGVLVAGLLAVAGHRIVLELGGTALMRARVLLLWAWLAASALVAAWPAGAAAEEAPSP